MFRYVQYEGNESIEPVICEDREFALLQEIVRQNGVIIDALCSAKMPNADRVKAWTNKVKGEVPTRPEAEKSENPQND